MMYYDNSKFIIIYSKFISLIKIIYILAHKVGESPTDAVAQLVRCPGLEF